MSGIIVFMEAPLTHVEQSMLIRTLRFAALPSSLPSMLIQHLPFLACQRRACDLAGKQQL